MAFQDVQAREDERNDKSTFTDLHWHARHPHTKPCIMSDGDAAAEAAAATRIASISRGRKARGEVKEKKKVKRERDEAITRIQATMRGKQARQFEQKQLEILEGFSSEMSTKEVSRSVCEQYVMETVSVVGALRAELEPRDHLD